MKQLYLFAPLLLCPVASCAAPADSTAVAAPLTPLTTTPALAPVEKPVTGKTTTYDNTPVPFALVREVTVAKEGAADFKTVQAAIDAAPDGATALYLVHIKPGTYREKLSIPKTKGPIKLLGENAATTILTFSDHAKTVGANGKEVGTSGSASTTVSSNNFTAENITFENAAGAVGQAVAFKLDGDRAILRRCRFTGWQDTLLLNRNRAYLEDCFVSGHVDFIFGGSTAYFQNCEINVRGGGYITAASTPETAPYGYVFANCRITSAEPGATWKTYLGRPWRPNASVIFLNTEMADVVRPEGWENWRNPANEKTARYSEVSNTGPGAATDKRVAWVRPITEGEAATLTPQMVLAGWNPNELSEERVASLPVAKRQQWEAYTNRSHALHEVEATQLEREAKGQKPVKAYAGKDFKMSKDWDATWFRSDAAKKITTALLSFQTPTGGWSKAVDYTQGPRQPGMQWTNQSDPFHYAATIDNRSTTEQIGFLNQVYALDKRADAKVAIERGIDYLLTAQYPSGGWPQTFPIEGGYHDAVTYNDNAVVHVLQLFTDISTLPEWAWVDAVRRTKAKAAAAAGLDYVLKSQYVQNGVKTVWCAQHDPLTYQPVAARLKEPASLSGGESVGLVRYLMETPPQTPEVVASIEAALAWFEKSKITDIKRVTDNGKKTYERQTTPQAPLWARFYDLKTNAPMFAGAQDGVIYNSYTEMAARNHFGYDYFVDQPEELLGKNQEKWRKKLAKAK